MRKGSFVRKVVACAVAGALCAGTTGVLVGCSGNSASSASSSASSSAAAQSDVRTFTDSLGREVEIPADVTAITPAGFTAQMILLTFAPEKMVSLAEAIAPENQKFFNVDADALPITGSMFGKTDTFNVESVAASGTQLIIDTGQVKNGMGDDLNSMQEKIGVPCVFIETTLDKYGTAYEMLGELLGDEKRGAELSKYCSDAYQTTIDTMNSIPSNEWVSIAYLMGEDGLNAIAKDSYQGGVIDLCANNVYVDPNASGSGYGMEISMEQLALWDPEYIVFMNGSIYDTVGSNPTWSDITAISNKNYYLVPYTPWNWLNNPPTVNQIMGVQWLPRLLYPQFFEDTIQDVATSYYKTFFNYELTDADFQEIAGNSVPN